MTRTYTVGPRVLVATLCLSVCLSSSLLAQRADRAIISGVVTDAQGAAVPGATVTIRNEATGVDTVQVTNDAGAYTTPPLVLGRYSVTVDLTGFKKAVSSRSCSKGATVTARHDPAGGRAQGDRRSQIRRGVNETQPDVSHTVNEKYYRDLPSSRPADVRLAESVLQMQPGYLPMKPNGDPMFRGSQFNSRINGGQRWRPRTSSMAPRSVTRRPPAEPGEHTSGGIHPGGKGHHDQLFGAVRPHQRRIHRVHGQVGHQRFSRQRLRVLCR